MSRSVGVLILHSRIGQQAGVILEIDAYILLALS